MIQHLPGRESIVYAALMRSLAAVTTQAAEFRGVAGIALDLGGDKLVTATFADGSTSDVRANQGLVFNAGVVMVNNSYETQAAAGYKFGGPGRSNGSIIWDTIPVELIQFLRAGNARIGLGFNYQINPKLVVDIPGTSQTYNFDNALGGIAQIGWAPAKMPFSVDLRYTSIKYKQSNVSNAREIGGNAFGLYAGYFF